MSNQKGSVAAWIVVLAMMFTVIQLWIIFSEIFTGNLFPWAETNFAKYNITGSSEMLTNIENAWNWWPMLFIIGLTIWGIASSTKTEYSEAISSG